MASLKLVTSSRTPAADGRRVGDWPGETDEMRKSPGATFECMVQAQIYQASRNCGQSANNPKTDRHLYVSFNLRVFSVLTHISMLSTSMYLLRGNRPWRTDR